MLIFFILPLDTDLELFIFLELSELFYAVCLLLWDVELPGMGKPNLSRFIKSEGLD